MSLRDSPTSQNSPLSGATLVWRSSWFRAWLLCLSCYFPIYWVSQFVLFALPSLLRVIAFGYRLRYLQMSPFMVTAFSTPADNPGDAGEPSTRAGSVNLLETVLLLAALVALRAH